MTDATDLVFFDGDCGLCHRSVLFLLRRDPRGDRFRFAPLAGTTLARELPEETRRTLPDSIVVRAADGRLLMRWRGSRRLLSRCGGVWRLVSGLMLLIPPAVGDRLYDGVARVRHRLFRRPEAACPVVPAQLRDRFLD